MSTVNNEQGMSYEEFIKNLNASGIKTTHVAAGKEANFEDYGLALSDDLKLQISDSFDCEQDYVLQQQLAGLFANKNVIQSGDFQAACKKMGLNVKVEYQKTSYIPDYKAGNFSNSVNNGNIAVYTISDGMGGEIKIADANGNGALESEELFMNQILGDINNQIGSITPSAASSASSETFSFEESNVAEVNIFSDVKEEEEVSQSDYNKEVEKYLDQGYSKEDAVRKADIKLNVNNLIYTGTAKEKEVDDKTEQGQEVEISQSEYNKEVEKYLDQGYSIKDSRRKADMKLNIDNLSYTGDKEAVA